VDSVIEQTRLKKPAAMGHSLGGMVAAMWGRKHAKAAGVVSLDGHGNPRPEQYLGLDRDYVAERRAELEVLQKAQLSALAGPLSTGQVEALTSQQRVVAARLGAPEDVFVEGLQRMLDVRADGVYLRPAPDGYGAEIYA